MENEKRHIWYLIAIALILCAVLIGYNIFFVKEPQAIIIETDAQEENIAENTGKTEYFTPSAKVNINTASAEQMAEELSGIGTALAERIVRYREENGDFTDISQIQQVSGIGEKKFEAIKDRLTVSE